MMIDALLGYACGYILVLLAVFGTCEMTVYVKQWWKHL